MKNILNWILIYALFINSALGASQIIDASLMVGSSSKPDSSAYLEVKGTSKGFLPPRMTNAQMVAIASPATGLLVYDTTEGLLKYWNGTSWVKASGEGLRAWVTSFAYVIGDVVHQGGKIYVALTDHTSGVFATDLGNGEWSELSDDLNRESSVTDNAIVRWDGAGGDDVQNSVVTIGDTGQVLGVTSQGIGGTPVASSLFDTVSTTQGARPCPSMTTAQRDAIAAPATGLCIYNTTTSKLNSFDGAEWVAIEGTIPAWETGTNYASDDVIHTANKIYVSTVDHTSGTFATDFGGGNWIELSSVVGHVLGTTNQVNVSTDALTGVATLSTPQDIHTDASPTFSTVNVDGHVAMSGADLTQTIRGTTSDGADNESVNITGGGALSATRGAAINLNGNEAANAGDLILQAGNVSGGEINFHTGGATKGNVSEAGAWTLGASGSTQTNSILGDKLTLNFSASQDYAFEPGSSNSVTLRGQSAATAFNFNLVPQTSDGSVANYLQIYASGTGPGTFKKMIMGHEAGIFYHQITDQGGNGTTWRMAQGAGNTAIQTNADGTVVLAGTTLTSGSQVTVTGRIDATTEVRAGDAMLSASLNALTSLTSGNNVKIDPAGTGGLEFTSFSGGQTYAWNNRDGGAPLYLQSKSAGTNFNLELFTNDSDNTDSNQLRVFGSGAPASVATASEFLEIGWDAGISKYKISAEEAGTGTLRELVISADAGDDQISVAPAGGVAFQTNTHSSGATVTVNGQFNIQAANEMRFEDSAGGEYVAFKASPSVTTTVYTLPTADGSDNQVLTTNGAGALAWEAATAVPAFTSVTKTTTYTATTSDVVIFVDTSGGDWDLDLYSPSGNSDKVLIVVKTSSDNNRLTIVPPSGTINGTADLDLSVQYSYVIIHNNGTNFFASTTGVGTPVRACFIHNSDGTPNVDEDTNLCDWITSITDTGTGDSVVNILSGTFLNNPVCVCAVSDQNDAHCSANSNNSASVNIWTGADAGGATDYNYQLICTGRR